MGNDRKRTDALVEVRDLVVHYVTPSGVVEAVNNVTFSIARGEALGLVGETGAGKTTIALSMMGLLPLPQSRIVQGAVILNGENLFDKTNKQMREIRGHDISMIFQDPMTALNPVQRVGNQIAEVIMLHQKASKLDARIKATEMLQLVGIPENRYNDYPHQFSGGMKQRVVIAIALACEPALLIADEPTTALDVTIQAQVLELIKELRQKLNTSMLLITHDFGVVAEMCDKCAVIYAGEIVEYGTLEDIFEETAHPYTIGLFNSLPNLDKRVDRLHPIKGRVANPMDLPSYCSFYERCDRATEHCKKQDPILREIAPGHFVKCLNCGSQEGGEKT